MVLPRNKSSALNQAIVKLMVEEEVVKVEVRNSMGCMTIKGGGRKWPCATKTFLAKF